MLLVDTPLHGQVAQRMEARIQLIGTKFWPGPKPKPNLMMIVQSSPTRLNVNRGTEI